MFRFQLAELTPQISHAGKLLLMNPGNELFERHFTDLCDDWRKNSDELIALVDAATDTLDYMKASEEAIRVEIAAAVSGMEKQNPAVCINHFSSELSFTRSTAVMKHPSIFINSLRNFCFW